MQEEYFEVISNYLGLVAWFVVLIAAQLSQMNQRKKLSRQEIVLVVSCSIVGGVMAYCAMYTYNKHYRLIGAAIGSLGGRVLVKWIMDSSPRWIVWLGEWVKKKFK